MPTAVRSHAKINLGLAIGSVGLDGFHSLATVYQTLALHDLVTVSARPAAATRLQLTTNDQRVPIDSHNTAWKMVELALSALKLTAEVEIHIEKRLPVQGGLGAGSANAAAALVGLEAELGIAGSREHSSSENAGPSTTLRSAQDDQSMWDAKRLEIAAQVGSDVPLFLIGGAVLGLDHGQEVYPLPDIEPVWCVVAAPAVGVSTPRAFRDWDELCAGEGLTAEASAAKLSESSRAYASAFAGAIPGARQGAGSSGVLFSEEDRAETEESALVRTGITNWVQNDFERVVFSQHPSLAEIKHILAASGTPEAALLAMLAGSGSALFGLYRTRGDAEAASERLRTAGVRSHLTRTLPRTAYWREMFFEDEG